MNWSELWATQGCVYFCPVSVISVRVLVPTFSGPSQVRRWSSSVSKSVLDLNESGYPQLLIALIDRLHCVCLYLLYKHNKTTREFYQGRPISKYNYKSYINQHKCHIFHTWSEFWLNTCTRRKIDMEPKHGTWNCIDYYSIDYWTK